MNDVSKKYFPQLDGLRAWAMLFVLIEHWLPEKHILNKYIPGAGWMGVTLFFVLSGYLIGSILLKEKYNLEENNSLTRKSILLKFYARRTLRIFPIYYLFIFLLLLLNYPPFIKTILPWLLTYSSNIYANIYGYAQLWPLTHLWTLCVEEQFYLIMPWIILFTPTKFLLRVIFIFIFSGIFFRTVFLTFAIGNQPSALTPSEFDSFGIGMLLGYLRLHKIKISYQNSIAIFSLLVYIVLSTTSYSFKGKKFLSVLLPSLQLFSVIIINKACEGFKGVGKLLLQTGLIIYIGKISYGMYIYHNVIPQLTSFFYNTATLQSEVLFFIYFVELIIIASFSYFVVERPILRLKKYL